jgi:hypothetical protein
MMLQRLSPIIREDVSSPLAVEEYGTGELVWARENFWEYRIAMNPRFILRNKWFPLSLARKLRRFWEDYKAGKRPVLLLETPPQHGKSLTVIDFIAWCIGHDPQLRVIYTSFSDRLSIRANLRIQRALSRAALSAMVHVAHVSMGASSAPRNSGSVSTRSMGNGFMAAPFLSDRCAAMTSLARRTQAQRPSIPGSRAVPFVIRLRCLSLGWSIEARSGDEFTGVSMPPKMPPFSWPRQPNSVGEVEEPT